METDNADTLISAPAAQFGKNIIEVMEFLRVMTVQAVILDEMTKQLGDIFSRLPVELRQQYIPDQAFEPVQELVSKGVGVTDILSRYIPLISELAYCRTVDYYLLYISELLALIFQTKPVALTSNDKISIEFILQYSDFKDLLDAITERKVADLSFKGMYVLNNELQKTLAFSLFENDEGLTKAIEIVENRNLFVHNRGIVNKIFLKRVPTSNKRVGDKLSRSEKILRDDLVFLSEAIAITDRLAAKKFGIPRNEVAPTSDLPIPRVSEIRLPPLGRS